METSDKHVLSARLPQFDNERGKKERKEGRREWEGKRERDGGRERERKKEAKECVGVCLIKERMNDHI